MEIVKTNNIFDYLQTDPENIDEKTIYENTGVNKENVREILMKKIHETKTTAAVPKKNKRKTITISLIAAAAVVAVVGTTAAAAGTFNPIFGQMFAGEAANGAYAGGNVKTNSDMLNIDFEGIVGDAHNAYSMMTITKKDGSAFVEDSKKVIAIDSSDTFGEEYDPTVTVSHSLLENVFGGKTEHRGSLSYYFEDDKTLKATVSVLEGRDIIGSTMNVNETAIRVFTIDEVIYSQEEYDYFRSLDENDEFWSDGLDIWTKAEKEYEKRTGNTLADNQAVMFGTNHNIVVAHYDTLEMDYDLSVRLNYKNTAVILDAMTGQELSIDGETKIITELKVEPFSMTLKTHKDDNAPVPEDEQVIDYDKDQEEFRNQELYQLVITLENGSKYYAELTSQNGTGGEDFFDEEYQYDGFTDGNKKAIINPSKIVSITYQDKELYHA